MTVIKSGTHIPIIKLYDMLIVSIQVELSDQLVMRLKDDIGEAISRFGPRSVIIDLSGVEILDSYISRAIRDIGLMAKLMGVDAVICGLDPIIAVTLTEMGMDLEGVSTFLDLEAAFEAINGGCRTWGVDDETPADGGGWNDSARGPWWSR